MAKKKINVGQTTDRGSVPMREARVTVAPKDYRLFCQACTNVAMWLEQPKEMGHVPCGKCGRQTPTDLKHWIYDPHHKADN